jgi:hypothetical protein
VALLGAGLGSYTPAADADFMFMAAFPRLRRPPAGSRQAARSSSTPAVGAGWTRGPPLAITVIISFLA